MMDVQSAIAAFTERRDLGKDEMTAVMRSIMTGDATAAQIGGFLIGLRMKGETVEEIAAAANVMRELSVRVDVDSAHLVDTCGTGGDSGGTFNISTASAFVVAGAGAKVAKHGNRAMSGRSGSADVLEVAGINLNLTPEQVAQCIESAGVGFMFAPNHHGAMRHAIAPRREMAVRTVFNLLGPLTNPAAAPHQVIGVYSADWVTPLAHVCRELGSAHVLVVHADDGLDEISISGKTTVAELKDGIVETYQVAPEQFGFATSPVASLGAFSPEDSLATVTAVLDDTPGPARDIVALNAGAAIYAAGLEASLDGGVGAAQTSIASGAARAAFDRLISLSRSLS